MTTANPSAHGTTPNPSTPPYHAGPPAVIEATSAWADEDFWRESFMSRPYVPQGARFDDYGPAYRYGAEAYGRHAPMGTWTEAEARLGMGWDEARGTSTLRWAEARDAARDAWERMKRNAAAGLR